MRPVRRSRKSGPPGAANLIVADIDEQQSWSIDATGEPNVPRGSSRNRKIPSWSDARSVSMARTASSNASPCARGVERRLSAPLVERRRLDLLPSAQTTRDCVKRRRDFGSPVRHVVLPPAATYRQAPSLTQY